MAQVPPQPQRSQSTTSLSKYYNGVNGGDAVTNQITDEELQDPKLDFCNAFWGPGDRGYEVVMARLRGATRTIDELRAYWKERASIEEDYAKRLSKLAKYPLGRDEIGDLAASLQNLQAETSAQASYHQSLSSELRTGVEGPVSEFANRLGGLKKGLQASIEKSWRNKNLQEGHVAKAKERYESDCLKLNSYTANLALTQGKEAEKLQTKLEKVRQTIGQNEQDFRQFVQVLQGTQQKWEGEWRGFCDHVQDIEEERLLMMKDNIWAFANALSQVCVEDDSSCERVRENLERFEPQNDMVAFVRGWGTGDTIPDPPKFVNYSLGEYPGQPTSRIANFKRLSARPPPSAMSHNDYRTEEQPAPASQPSTQVLETQPNEQSNGVAASMQNLSLRDEQQPSDQERKAPFAGIAQPGMSSLPPANDDATASHRGLSAMAPPPTPPTMSMPEPRIPSRQGPPTPSAIDDDDPMARALADLRRDPPPPGSIRRAPSSRRPGSVVNSIANNDRNKAASPAPGALGSANRMSQANLAQAPDMGLSPPAAGHTAAQLAKSMDDFQRRPDKRASTSYNAFTEGQRSSSPAVGNRAPSPAMMQPPTQAADHIADHVLPVYGQAFPGERSRSRANSINSRRSSMHVAAPDAPQSAQYARQASPAPREAFAGIDAGGAARAASPMHGGGYRSPSPNPMGSQGNLGPQNLGIALDATGSVAQDSMAEAYRRQYQAQQQSQQNLAGQAAPALSQQQQPARGSSLGRPTSFIAPSSQGHGSQQQQQPQQQGYTSGPGSSYGHQPSQSQSYGHPINSPISAGPPPVGQRPTSAYGGQAPQQAGSYQAHAGPQQSQQPQYAYQGSVQQQQPQHQSRSSYSSPAQTYQAQQQTLSPQQQYQPNAYGQQTGPTYGGYQTSVPAPTSPVNPYGRGVSPAPVMQQQPQQQQQYGYRAPSPQPSYGHQSSIGHAAQHQQQQQQQYSRNSVQRSPSPQPAVPPNNVAPTGQWSTTGQPVLFYVKAMYDYTAQSAAEFDFQAGDIIAVTATPEDGWWSGELLDEARRLPGRSDFPSNFVSLF